MVQKRAYSPKGTDSEQQNWAWGLISASWPMVWLCVLKSNRFSLLATSFPFGMLVTLFIFKEFSKEEKEKIAPGQSS